MHPRLQSPCLAAPSLSSARASGGLARGPGRCWTRTELGSLQGASQCPLGLGTGLAAAGGPTRGDSGRWGMPGAWAAPLPRERLVSAEKPASGGSCVCVPRVRPER